nr:hypothetical protein [Tanacetum cinerariifolium]
MEERLMNGWIIIPRDFDEVKTKLKEARTQIRKLQKKRMGQRDKIAFISDGGNTEDGVKITGGVIGFGGGIGGISSFLEFSKKSEEMFPDSGGDVFDLIGDVVLNDENITRNDVEMYSGNLIDGKSISSESNGLVMQPE